MSRNFLSTIIAVIALGSAATIASTFALSNLAWSENVASGYGQTWKTKADFDRTFADVAAAKGPTYTDADRDALRRAGLKLLSGSKSQVLAAAQ
jgi:hypothetical protein